MRAARARRPDAVRARAGAAGPVRAERSRCARPAGAAADRAGPAAAAAAAVRAGDGRDRHRLQRDPTRGVLDPSAAQRAEYAYRLALSRLQMGDRASAAAYAASALAIANAGVAAGEARAIAPIDARALTGGAAPAAAATAKRYGAFGNVTLPDYLIAARDRIAAARAHGANVTVATRRLRAAVDAWLAGDAAQSKREAHAATAALSVSR